MTPEEIKKLVDDKIDEALVLASKKVGDTPTDANQLVPKKYVDARVYGGTVLSAGQPGPKFPTGWSSALISTGTFEVTHNLGSSVYSVVISLINADAKDQLTTGTVSSMLANSFRTTFVATATPTTRINAAHNFILHR